MQAALLVFFMCFHFGKLCLFMALLLASSHLQAKEKLIWVTDDQAELENYLNDSYVSIGTDTTKLVIQSLLKWYDVDIQLTQLPRTNILLTRLPNICTSNRIKTKERLKHNFFSSAVNIFPSIRLYFLHNTRYQKNIDLFKPLLNENNELISFALLFNTFPELRLGVSKGRSFGKDLDNQLINISSKNLIVRAGVGRYKALDKMLFKNRIDFNLKFPIEFKQELDAYPEKTSVDSLAIAGNDHYILGHIACSQSDFGRRVIERVNSTLHRLYRQADFYKAHSRYLNEMDMVNFDRYYQEVYQVKPPLKLLKNE